MCARPYRQGIAEYGCGQCMPCRFNRRRVWVTRLMLERNLHEKACCATLTYSDENLPEGGSVSIRDAQLFIKRLRKAVEPERLRYYIVGEYGDISFRPHYHAVLFGVCDAALVLSAWNVDGRPLGHVYVDEVSDKACSYVVSYVTKRMTGKEDVRLGGRAPEFARMSLKPGLGRGATEVIGNALTSKGGSSHMAKFRDVPGSVRFDGGFWPLGRYLLNSVREQSGMVRSGGLFGRRPLLESHVERLKELQAELVLPGARVRREESRSAEVARVDRRLEITRSKKGIGL